METIEHLTEATATEAPMRSPRRADTRLTLQKNGRWPLERVLFALAGTMTLLSVLLAVAVSKWVLLLTAFVGVNQWLYVVAGVCPASVLLRRTCRLRSAIYPSRDRAAARRDEVTV